ncbi:11868_t:CDS:2 [Entrophospora sp. SA101]|nr:11864_t:CDS:2 [Entrophospora sp. SA101]CAJ0827414.1 11868_t:CDS:2 [Entrophospora sp. SA101]
MSNEGENWDFMKVAPVLTGPFFIVIGYRFLALWYRRKEANEISQLESLRAQQSLKVEELKKKTGYYTTKTLLERYDSPTRLPTNQQPMSPGQKNPLTTTTPGSLKPGTPNSLPSRSTSRKRKGSHHRSSAENDDNEGFEDNRFKHYNVKDGIDDNNE